MTTLPAPLADLRQYCHQLELPAGQQLMSPGQACQGFIWVLSGQVAVSLLGRQGRDVELYRLNPGDSCVLTTSCLFGNSPFPATAATTRPCRLLLLPEAEFNRALEQSPSFRRLVFASLGERLAALMAQIESIAFDSIDSRLARALLAPGHDELAVTHEQLAQRIGSAREVVSRRLSHFSRQGWLSLSRGHIRLLNADALRRLL
ncbi:Crp/Fnr family transcriptional regulator [Zobellella denitrificans]|uniref:Crp/Fnr family transcriptional regulator n=1 Tax=Zobellella denitrificans TaxID=347534 RepID=UPI000B8C1B3D|nr:Crp/Fnr family transcriptional regulator [Zobellella denitrificans]OXS14234.1 Crp/Fnr family transcriptional regulator [Zobellella denitrificans]